MSDEKSQKQRFAAFEKVFASPDGEKVFAELVITAMGEADPMIRCGKSDLILKILRERQRCKETAPRGAVGRSSLAGKQPAQDSEYDE